jgi:predicted enzyme related to lactoylglutathione lyase
MNHLSNWIEIPVTDMARARTFYEALLGESLAEFPFGPLTYAMFPTRDRHNAGALVMGEGYVPSREGALVYLNAAGCLDTMLARAEASGADILMPKTFLSEEAGEAAILLDTEGNRIGLQSPAELAAKSPEGEAVTEPVTDGTMQAMLGAAMPQVAFLLKRGPAYDDPASAPLQWEHARNMFTLMRYGRLSHVSALLDGTDVLGFGLMSAGSREEAEAILREDPAVHGGRLVVELLSSISFDGERTHTRLQ